MRLGGALGLAEALLGLPGVTHVLATQPGDEGDALVECRDCGLFQRTTAVSSGEALVCRRCEATLREPKDNRAAWACVIAALVLFGFTLGLPLLSLRATGRFAKSDVFSGPIELRSLGYGPVAALVLITMVALPALRLVVLFAALLAERIRSAPPGLPWVFGWLERLGPWAMIDVFMMAIFVAYTRLRVLAQVDVGLALVALFSVMVAGVAAESTLDREALWEALESLRPPPPSPRPRTPPPRGETRALLGCRVCRKVTHSAEGSPCPRCGHRLKRRKGYTLERTWAFVLAALALYVPANTLPVMTVIRTGRGGPHTIMSGVIQLFNERLWPLGVIVTLASIVVPLAKVGGLATLLVWTHLGKGSHLVGLTKVFRVISVIGRWSMIDIFAMCTLVGLVQWGVYATCLPGAGATAFAAVVVLTMLGAECFDPRTMWDRAAASGALVERDESSPRTP